MFVKQITSNSLVVGAPAKVNLFLEVLSRRPDGYHNINSLFQAVSLFDRITFRRTESPGVRIGITSGPQVPTDNTNLMAKVYQLLVEEFTIKSGLEILIEKNIPIGAGLGGGSSDAAACLTACNLLFDLRLSKEELSVIALNVGSDIPFFFSGGQAQVTGRGELITKTSYPVDYWIVLVTPAINVSTAQSYAALRIGLTPSRPALTLQSCRTLDEFVEFLKISGNDFERNHLIRYPELGRIKEKLLINGAKLARMSGSGSTIFGIYSEPPSEERIGSIEEDNWHVHTVRPISLEYQHPVEAGGNRGDNRDTSHTER